MYVPPLLSSILVVIPFHWDLNKLNLLRLTITEVVTYNDFTAVETIIITDKFESITNAVKTFDLNYPVRIWEFNSSSPNNGGGAYDMLWEHRTVIETVFHEKNYTSFLYMEDDTHFPWPQLVSWAMDTEVLEPLGFTRGIYRTEINDTGFPSMNDMVVNLMNKLGCSMNLTADTSNPTYVQTLNITAISSSVRSSVSVGEMCFPGSNTLNWYSKHLAHQRKSSKHHTSHAAVHNSMKHSKGNFIPCKAHTTYVQLYSPFHGLTVLSRSQQEKFMKHPFWHKGKAMQKNTLRSGKI